ncbi:hypothetical protein J7E50_02635 [Pedobacter sp. ISL-68]|uniref:hypothetical protein n=1 Tax=unclassified Pedobacter TaxID=2628915 RepID=UPI001BE6A761|nr:MULTISPECIES: hypothetical protein [unclassified Pedobacter]MBT2560118.1 hypothetical protein [Pedobacter sp. ISL-64]MBT2589097.1 hypothetical protein [Pedobacter sp. ISL-68]
MSNIKSLADQLRGKITEPDNKGSGEQTKETVRPKDDAPVKTRAEPKIPPILDLIRAYDNSDHKSMVHVRFDAKTLQTMNQLKMATGVDVTKLVAYSVRQLFALHPELKTIIKQFLLKLE